MLLPFAGNPAPGYLALSVNHESVTTRAMFQGIVPDSATFMGR